MELEEGEKFIRDGVSYRFRGQKEGDYWYISELTGKGQAHICPPDSNCN